MVKPTLKDFMEHNARVIELIDNAKEEGRIEGEIKRLKDELIWLNDGIKFLPNYKDELFIKNQLKKRKTKIKKSLAELQKVIK